MGHRLSKIYTRTGDKGTTGLGDGSRTAKDAPRVEAMGAVDELNCAIGVLLTQDVTENSREELTRIQHTLFDIGGELSIPGYSIVKSEEVEYLEHALDAMNKKLAPLKEFILPGGSAAAAYCHVARSACRLAERRTCTLSDTEDVSEVSRQYLNRLSDYLFVLARHLNKQINVPDVLWKHERKKKKSSTTSSS